MDSERFVKKEYPYDWWFVFDNEQEYVESMNIPFPDMDNLAPMSEKQVVNLLNEYYFINQELYDFRLTYNALLFNNWNKYDEYEVYKSKKHHDGELCIDGEYFIVVAILPSGQVTNHYHIKDWDLFKIPVYDKVKDEFDGHTSKDVLQRLKKEI